MLVGVPQAGASSTLLGNNPLLKVKAFSATLRARNAGSLASGIIARRSRPHLQQPSPQAVLGERAGIHAVFSQLRDRLTIMAEF